MNMGRTLLTGQRQNSCYAAAAVRGNLFSKNNKKVREKRGAKNQKRGR